MSKQSVCPLFCYPSPPKDVRARADRERIRASTIFIGEEEHGVRDLEQTARGSRRGGIAVERAVGAIIPTSVGR